MRFFNFEYLFLLVAIHDFIFLEISFYFAVVKIAGATYRRRIFLLLLASSLKFTRLFRINAKAIIYH